MEQQPLRLADIIKLVDLFAPQIGGGIARRLTPTSYELLQFNRRHGCQPFIKLLVPPEQYRSLLEDVRTKQPTVDYEVRPGLLCFAAVGIGFEVEVLVVNEESSPDRVHTEQPLVPVD